jgi:hypothetical protein
MKYLFEIYDVVINSIQAYNIYILDLVPVLKYVCLILKYLTRKLK